MEKRYNIKDLENLTGIKAHTLRIWEKRYEILTPKRSEKNIRYYDIEDLRRILNINSLYSNGFKISHIAKLNEDELVEKVQLVFENQENVFSKECDEILNAIIEFDTPTIEEKLDEHFKKFGIVDLYLNIINPTLVRIGELWQLKTITISHEHLFSNTLRKFVLAKTDGLDDKKSKSNKVILFLLKDEHHELTMLFYHYLLKDFGWNVIYLGQNVPIEELHKTIEQTNPDFILTSIIAITSEKSFKKQLSMLTSIIPEEKLCLSGSSVIANKKIIPENVKVINNFGDISRIFTIGNEKPV